MDINSGDIFRINHKKIKLKRPCKNPDKVFVVDYLSKSKMSVYYIDKRTSIKCSCYYCDGGITNKFRYGRPKREIGNVTRSIGVDDIIIIERKLERERNLKLKIILNDFKISFNN